MWPIEAFDEPGFGQLRDTIGHDRCGIGLSGTGTAPIDGVGFEMHIGNLHPDMVSISASIGRFSGLGVHLHTTHLYVRSG
jgi:hypothetical protein